MRQTWKPAIEFRSIDKVIPYTRNVKLHSDSQVVKIAASIKANGFTQPIVVDKEGVIICGHGRLLGALHLGMKEVPVVVADHLDEYEVKAYRIADNKIAEAEWDKEMLGFELGSLDVHGFDLSLTGFDLGELDEFMPKDPGDGSSGAGGEDEDSIPGDVKDLIGGVNRGDIWILGKHRLMCGDSSSIEDVKKLVSDQLMDMLWTDPPYGVSYVEKNKMLNSLKSPKGGLETVIENDNVSVEDLKVILLAAFKNADAVLADKSCYYVSSPQGGELGMMMMMMMMMQEANLYVRHMMIWVKNNPVFSMGRLDYDYQHEPILFGWSKNRTHHKSTQEGQWKSSVWQLNRENNTVHPTMKPIALIENSILNSCPKNGHVLDLFCGSGSTLIACEKTGRHGYGMEIYPHYCGVILRRWAEYTGNDPVRESDGALWSDVMKMATT